MKNKQRNIIIGVAIVVVVAVFLLWPNNPISDKVSPVSIITLSDENSSIVITKNNIQKTANIDMTLYMSDAELNVELFGDMTEFMTTMSCGLMQMAFFNETALTEFTQEIEEWNAMDSTIEDEGTSEEPMEEPMENQLKGYEIKTFNLLIKDKNTKQTISECLVTGPSEEDILISIK